MAKKKPIPEEHTDYDIQLEKLKDINSVKFLTDVDDDDPEVIEYLIETMALVKEGGLFSCLPRDVIMKWVDETGEGLSIVEDILDGKTDAERDKFFKDNPEYIPRLIDGGERECDIRSKLQNLLGISGTAPRRQEFIDRINELLTW